MPDTINMKRVFSGIQPSGDLHLGNYVGALKGWVNQQNNRDNFFCIVDLHALTVKQNPDELRDRTLQTAALYIACGIDPIKSCVFIQSHVSVHAEVCWLLNCITPLGWLERMTQYKDKSLRTDSILAGLLDYPVLMAADIIIYDAHEVPVGEDQKQHVELARDIAQRFNRIYGETFVVPEPVISKTGARVMGLNDATIKMSKEHSKIRGHSVRLLDDPKEIERSFKRAVTDSYNEIRFSDDTERAGVNNLLGIYKVITGKTESQVEKDFENLKGYGSLKTIVAEVVIEELRPIQEKYARIMNDSGELHRILLDGGEKAAEISESKLSEVKYKMGLLNL